MGASEMELTTTSIDFFEVLRREDKKIPLAPEVSPPTDPVLPETLFNRDLYTGVLTKYSVNPFKNTIQFNQSRELYLFIATSRSSLTIT